MGNRYFIVHEEALPKGLVKVYEAQAMLRAGKARTINDAVKKAGISRSAYYKYKNLIEPYEKPSDDRLMTIQAVLSDRVGVLSNFLNALARSGSNVLTLNQSIPVNNAASVTLTLRINEMRVNVEKLSKRLLSIEGVISMQIMMQ